MRKLNRERLTNKADYYGFRFVGYAPKWNDVGDGVQILDELLTMKNRADAFDVEIEMLGKRINGVQKVSIMARPHATRYMEAADLEAFAEACGKAARLVSELSGFEFDLPDGGNEW